MYPLKDLVFPERLSHQSSIFNKKGMPRMGHTLFSVFAGVFQILLKLRIFLKKSLPVPAAGRGTQARGSVWAGSGVSAPRFALSPARNSPAHRAVKGATVTRPKEPMTVWMSSAATYL